MSDLHYIFVVNHLPINPIVLPSTNNPLRLPISIYSVASSLYVYSGS